MARDSIPQEHADGSLSFQERVLDYIKEDKEEKKTMLKSLEELKLGQQQHNLEIAVLKTKSSLAGAVGGFLTGGLISGIIGYFFSGKK